MYIAPGQGQTTPRGQNFYVNRKALSLYPFVASFKEISLKSDLSCLLLRQARHIGSVLFRTSACIGAKQESWVPTGSKQNKSQHTDDVKDVSVLLESELIGSG